MKKLMNVKTAVTCISFVLVAILFSSAIVLAKPPEKMGVPDKIWVTEIVYYQNNEKPDNQIYVTQTHDLSYYEGFIPLKSYSYNSVRRMSVAKYEGYIYYNQNIFADRITFKN
jgi:hypothetical protein